MLAAAPAPTAPRWQGSWGYPPSPLPAGAHAQPVLHPVRVPEPPLLVDNPGGVEVIAASVAAPPDPTVRQIVRVSRGGGRVRLHFSNEAGSEPLVIAQAHLARLRADGSADPASDRVIRFGGAAGVTIPASAPFDSDPVVLAVHPLERLAITLHLAGTAPRGGHMLYHYVATGSGDASAATVLPGARLARLDALVTRIDVAGPGGRCGTVVALGDSITEGAHATLNAFRSWPDRLAQRLAAGGNGWAVVNAGIGGNRLLRNVTGPNALARFDRDVLGVPGARVVLLMEGINDIGRSFTPEALQEPVTLEQLQAAARQIVARAHDHGIGVLGATLTPYRGAHYFAEPGETMRRAYNDWIRGSGTFDGVIDMDAAVRDPAEPSRIDPRFDAADHLHFNDAGYERLGDAVPLPTLRRVARCRG